jgi:hypothetical protein
MEVTITVGTKIVSRQGIAAYVSGISFYRDVYSGGETRFNVDLTLVESGKVNTLKPEVVLDIIENGQWSVVK